MSLNQKKNAAHSIFQRLLHCAKTNREDFNLLLSRYATERFLYRLSVSAYSESFILKGASLLLVWTGHNYRVTRDADFLGIGTSDTGRLAEVFRDICGITFQDDGMIYLPDSVKSEEIREHQQYKGVRITIMGLLNRARIPLQLDIGFGDVITPAPETVEYPTILDAPAPLIMGCSRYTVVAEKFEAMVKLGLANSRMKDFFDVWLLSRLFSFDGNVLRTAVKNTFAQRRTAVPESKPVAFSPVFYADSQKNVQWSAFVKKSRPDMPVNDLSSVIVDIAAFLSPVFEQPHSNVSGIDQWLPDQGWCFDLKP